ncbi:unnamed protein product [Amoebophrya sp. A25]|nr:unnamed protein product [Amoebophrya sp. A25]|eukprot:GSA25T00017060001.1
MNQTKTWLCFVSCIFWVPNEVRLSSCIFDNCLNILLS